ncbi:hypothetical protein [Oceanobacillus sp. CFH 90083]|uniref:hypothetical protein n=1 Tax=Oceanobacillus sp. CFH 90083 TaxID=2592336 RepID=UPI00128D8A6F|nr:hypothetical protein [Oceanobacillus sp. CFH 90083]
MNRLKYCFLIIIMIIPVGCSTIITEEDLIGGEWVATAGYKDGEPEGEADCFDIVSQGLEFKDEKTVYSKGYESDFNYGLEEIEGGLTIYLERNNGSMHRTYFIEKISEDEFGLKGRLFFEGQNCYFARQ